MINNIFNQFDPISSLLNPFLISILTVYLFLSPHLNINIPSLANFYLINNFINENSTNLISNNNNITNPFLINVIISVTLINISALTIYAWSSTSHLSININLILILWIPILLIILINNKKHFIIHLIPQGTPNILIPFMFIIELISFFIRPITLIIRLTANIIAGHIIIALNSNLILSSSTINILPSISFALLNLIEIIVAILQAYIIITLISIFISEI